MVSRTLLSCQKTLSVFRMILLRWISKCGNTYIYTHTHMNIVKALDFLTGFYQSTILLDSFNYDLKLTNTRLRLNNLGGGVTWTLVEAKMTEQWSVSVGFGSWETSWLKLGHLGSIYIAQPGFFLLWLHSGRLRLCGSTGVEGCFLLISSPATRELFSHFSSFSKYPTIDFLSRGLVFLNLGTDRCTIWRSMLISKAWLSCLAPKTLPSIWKELFPDGNKATLIQRRRDGSWDSLHGIHWDW